MNSLFGIDLPLSVRWLIGLSIILGLAAILGLFLRGLAGGRIRLGGQSGARGRQPRLGVVDTFDLDRQRQLVLIRRDNVEHLILVGGSSDVLIETNIVRGVGRVAAPQPAADAALDLPPLPSPSQPSLPLHAPVADQAPAKVPEPPRAQVPAARETAPLPDMPRHEPLRQEPSRQEMLRPAEPARVTEPVGQPTQTEKSVPSPVSPSAPPPPFAPVTVTSPAMTGIASAAVPIPPASLPKAAPPVEAGKDDLTEMTRQLEEALKRPFSAVRPTQLKTDVPTPPTVAPQPAEPPKASSPSTVQPSPALQPPPPATGAPGAAAPGAEPPGFDLEDALAKALSIDMTPASPVPGGLAVPARPADAGRMQASSPAATPVPSAPASRAPEPKPVPAETAPERTPPRPEKPVASQPAGVPPVPAPQASAVEAPKSASAQEADPFSVDAIEAEFARLLGRTSPPKT